MPRTWPSMRFSRFARPAVSSCECATVALTGCGSGALRAAFAAAPAAATRLGDVIAGVLDRTRKRIGVRAGGVVAHTRLPGVELHVHLLDAVDRLQHTRDARHASAARHAL